GGEAEVSGGPLRCQGADVLGQAGIAGDEPGTEEQDLGGVGVPPQERLIPGVDHREVEQYLLHVPAGDPPGPPPSPDGPADGSSGAGSGRPSWIRRSRAEVLTIAIRSSTSTRPQWCSSRSVISARVQEAAVAPRTSGPR